MLLVPLSRERALFLGIDQLRAGGVKDMARSIVNLRREIVEFLAVPRGVTFFEFQPPEVVDLIQ